MGRERSEPLSLGAQLCCDFSSRDEWRTAFDECMKGPNERFAAIWASLLRGAQLLTPLGWIGDADQDIAPVVVFLCSKGARYITGQTIVVDGGRYTAL